MASSSSSSSSSSSLTTNKATSYRIPVADPSSWYCAIALLTLILVGSIRENNSIAAEDEEPFRGLQFLSRPCEEIYIVGEGETLNTISDKCDDPYIVERNPHIHDPDDVFPGLVIKITPSKTRKLLR